MAHDSRDGFVSREGHGDAARQTQRREFLRALAGGLGFFAVGSPALGQSLLVRAFASPRPSFDQPTTTTASWSDSLTYTLAGTDPATITWGGRSTAPDSPGTYTQTAPPLTGGTASYTNTFAAPSGQTQTVTIAVTQLFSMTPPLTNYETVSWEGSYYTISSSHTPTYLTLTASNTLTATYTTVTHKGGFMDGMSPSAEGHLRLARATDGSDLSIDAIDAPDCDLKHPCGRRTQASIVRFTHGIVS